jgi:2,3-dihydroxybiphenyl 1,2-dioxygenase
MTGIALGYIGLSVSNPEAWKAFGRDVLGVMEAPVSPGGVCRLRVDEHAWRIALEPGEQDDLAYVGFELAGPEALEAVVSRLTAAGVACERAGEERRKERGVMALVGCVDPQGLPVEFYYGPTHLSEIPFASSQGVRFVTGEQGLGHVVLATTDIAATRRFYLDLLGFRQSDTIRMEVAPNFALDLEFYYGNPRHHTLAVAPVPMMPPKRTHHIMLQVETLDEVGYALDRAARTGVKVTQSLGRHSNDKMVSFYCATPSGFELEYGFGAIEVEDSNWRMARHDKISAWGHQRL